MHDGVGDGDRLPVEVLGAGGGVDDPQLPRGLVEQVGDPAEPEEQVLALRAAYAGVLVVGVVGDHQQRPAGRDGRGQGGVQVVEDRARHVQEEDRDQVVGPARDRLLDEVGTAPVDVEALLGGPGGGPVERHLRQVDPGDLPAARGQPQRVAALAAAHVEGRAGP